MTILYLILCLFLIQIPFIFADYRATCLPNNNVINQVENYYQVKLYQPSVNFSYNIDNIHINTVSAADIKLQLTAANVTFTGYVLPHGNNDTLKINVNFTTNPTTFQRRKNVQGSETKEDCSVLPLTNYNISLDLPRETKAMIINLTDHCIHSHLCRRFDTFIVNDFLQIEKREQHPYKRQISRPVNTEISENIKNDKYRYLLNTNARSESNTHLANYAVNTKQDCGQTSRNGYNPQSTINAMMDFGMATLISKITVNGTGTIQIPDIYTNFSHGAFFFETTGEFIANGGTFRDLRGLERIKDVVFTHDKLQFSVSSTYRLALAKLKFNYYKIRYGKIKIDGVLGVAVDGITLSANMSFDYNQKPCQAILREFDVKELGKIKVNFTGLGFLNGQVSKLIGWLIKSKAFANIKDTISQKLDDFDCEKFRP